MALFVKTLHSFYDCTFGHLLQNCNISWLNKLDNGLGTTLHKLEYWFGGSLLNHQITIPIFFPHQMKFSFKNLH